MQELATNPSVAEGIRDDNGTAYLPDDRTKRFGIGLCLSGGGYRATLFHLGALRRLNELGILTRSDFRTVSSVSGGSIAAALLANVLRDRINGIPIDPSTWENEFEKPLRSFTSRNIRTPALARRLLPWNVLRSSTGVESLAKIYEKHLTSRRLSDLPDMPVFVLCSTDMSYGVNWIFEANRMGDYQAGYRVPDSTFALARAVAASSCFPPVFNPLPMDLKPDQLTGGKAKIGPERDDCISDLRLTDGGNYDNMGLEPVWKDHQYVLVSDAGGNFANKSDQGLLRRLWRYQAIQENQSRALRKRWLISNFSLKELSGAYWGTGSAVASYGFTGGYTKDLAREIISEIRTDLDAFSDAEAAVLVNHGYQLVDAAFAKHVPMLLPGNIPPAKTPYPAWMDEVDVRKALASSHKRRKLGRW